MKNKLYTLTIIAVLFVMQSATAQIQITQYDMPSAGSVYYQENSASLFGVDFATTGANHTWDFTNLIGTGIIDTVTFVAVTSTPFAYQLFFNNAFAYPNTKSDLAVPAGDITPALPAELPIPMPLQITNVINYFKKKPTEYTITGFGAEINGFPSSSRYEPTDKLYALPLDFNDSYAGDFQWNISIPSMMYYGQNKSRESVVDGWGTLNLPNDATYEVLRVKSTVTGVDTFYVEQIGNGFAVPSTVHEYKWLAKTEGLPVLQINTREIFGGMEQITSVKYKYTPAPTGIDASPEVAFSVYPNPAREMVTISNAPTGATLSIKDITGKTTYRSIIRNEQTTINTADFVSGVYIIEINNNGVVTNRKLVVNH